jgi:hypothetical protein
VTFPFIVDKTRWRNWTAAYILSGIYKGRRIKKSKSIEDYMCTIRRYISLIRSKKSAFSWLRKGKAGLTLLQPATENSKAGKAKQRTRDQETKEHESSMNNKIDWRLDCNH